MKLQENLAKVILGLALKVLAQQLPWAMAWPFGPIVSFFLDKGIRLILHETVIGGFFMWFDWSQKVELNAVERAIKAITEHEGVMNEEEIKRAELRLESAYFELIEFNTKRVPTSPNT